MSPDLSFTDEQRVVIEADPDDRILLIAGAGTGKTAALIARIQRLAGRHGLSVGSELLVLTFSRAAVGELRKRLRETGGKAAYVKVATFDSFATRMLALHHEEDTWADSDYDGRIAHALELLRNDPGARAHLKDYRHLIVDEIQDLVADRARLVLALVSGIGGGYTLAGDPAQSIYDFQLAELKDDFDSRAFLARLTSLNGKAPSLVSLSRNFRALSEEARMALSVGTALADPDIDADRVRLDLSKIVDRLDGIRSRDLAPRLRECASKGSTTGVLTRYNGQAMSLSRFLHEGEIPHRLQRSATERALAPWMGGVLYDFKGGRLSEARLEELLEERPHESAPSGGEAWRLLRRAVGTPGPSVELRRLGQAFAAGMAPDELTWHPPATIIVSTVHRAKGLEFDEVFIVDPSRWDREDAPEDETRTLYVALTRARRSMRILTPPGPWNLARRDMPGDRWVWFGKKDWQRYGMEFRSGDVESRSPPSGSIYGDGEELQEYLRIRVSPGDPVDLLRFVRRTEAGPRVHYRLKHAGRAIGETAQELSRDLFVLLKSAMPWKKRVRFPDALRDLVVEGVETCTGPPSVARQAGLGNSGFWLRPRVVGLARFEWRRKG